MKFVLASSAFSGYKTANTFTHQMTTFTSWVTRPNHCPSWLGWKNLLRIFWIFFRKEGRKNSEKMTFKERERERKGMLQEASTEKNREQRNAAFGLGSRTTQGIDLLPAVLWPWGPRLQPQPLSRYQRRGWPGTGPEGAMLLCEQRLLPVQEMPHEGWGGETSVCFSGERTTLCSLGTWNGPRSFLPLGFQLFLFPSGGHLKSR